MNGADQPQFLEKIFSPGLVDDELCGKFQWSDHISQLSSWMSTGIGVEFSYDHLDGVWTVKEVLENFCLPSDSDSSSGQLAAGDEIFQVLRTTVSLTCHISRGIQKHRT